MDTGSKPPPPASAPEGGAAEPLNRAAVAKERFQTPIDDAVERFELRDPVADLTYRSVDLTAIVARAEELGSRRFVAVDRYGQRSDVQKVDGQWQRTLQRDGSSAGLQSLEAGSPSPNSARPVARSGRAPNGTSATVAVEVAEAKAPAQIDKEAERVDTVARLEAELRERFVVKGAPVHVGDVTLGRSEYRFRGDVSRVAFTESTFRLATDTNSPSIARAMVDVAEARNWRALRVSGHEDFRRMVWLEASVRGVKTVGYEPSPPDLELLSRQQEARLVNRIERTRPENPAGTSLPTGNSPKKESARGGGGRKAVLAAIEAVLIAKKVPEAKRAAVMAAATEQLAQRIRDGQTPRVKVYDRGAPSNRPAPTMTQDIRRTRDRAEPSPGR